MGDDILRHLLVRTIMLRERGCRRIGLGQGLFIGAGIMHVEKTAHEIALRHALGADDAETAEIIGNVEIGMESKRSAVFIFDDRRLVIDDVAVAVENLVGSHPAARLAMVNLHVVDAIILRRIGRREAFAPAKARYETGSRADNTIVEIEIVAAFFEHERAGIVLVTPPVAHEECAVIGRNMLGSLDGNDIAKLTFSLCGAQIAVKRRISQN